MKRILWFAIIVAIAGMWYSGSLSYNKLIYGVCLINSSCPYLFGLPVCYYGFMGFLTLFVLMFLALNWSDRQRVCVASAYWISLFGSFFALYFLIQELFIIGPPGGVFHVSIFYPSCLFGLIGFVSLYILLRMFSRKMSNS